MTSFPATNLAKTEMHEVACVSYGVPFLLQIGNQAHEAAVLECLPHATNILPSPCEGAQRFSFLPPSATHGYRYFAGAELVLESEAPGPALEMLQRDVMVHVANHAPDYVFLHAGVVARHGHALVLPGKSFAGKTTLVASLLRQGATYYSDEYAVLDVDGRVHPYARALQMRSPGNPQQKGVDAAEFAATIGDDAIRVAYVVFAQYEEGAHWDPQPISPGMAALEMLRHAIPVQRTPARVMNVLSAMLRDATAIRSLRGEADQTAASLLALMDALPAQMNQDGEA